MGATSSIPSSSGAHSTTAPVPTLVASFSCPLNDNTLYNSAKQIYRLRCNMDFSGADFGWSSGSGLLDCVGRCDSVTGCSATVYSPSSRACYFKGPDARYRPVANAQGAILDRLANQIPISNSVAVSMSSKSLKSTVTTPIITSTTTKHDRQSTSIPDDASKKTTNTVSSPSNAIPSDTGQSLSILALGDSITAGYIAQGAHNSYRLALMNMLLNNMPLWNVSLHSQPGAMYRRVGAVGGVHSGNFSQAYCEGYPAKQIDYIRSAWSNNSIRYPQKPDVLLVLAGINDVVQNVTDESTLQATQRLGSFVDALTKAYPAATVIVSTLTPVLIEDWKPQVNLFNVALPNVLQSRIAAGNKILLVDMFSALATTDIADWVHPTAQGYVKMAKVFLKGIETARGRGWLR